MGYFLLGFAVGFPIWLFVLGLCRSAGDADRCAECMSARLPPRPTGEQEGILDMQTGTYWLPDEVKR